MAKEGTIYNCRLQSVICTNPYFRVRCSKPNKLYVCVVWSKVTHLLLRIIIFYSGSTGSKDWKYLIRMRRIDLLLGKLKLINSRSRSFDLGSWKREVQKRS